MIEEERTLSNAELRALSEIERLSRLTGYLYVDSAVLTSGLNIRASLRAGGYVETWDYQYSRTEYCVSEKGRDALAKAAQS